MKTIEQLRQFYDEVLAKDLAALEVERKKLAAKITSVALCALVILAVGSVIIISAGAPPPFIFLLLIFCVILIVIVTKHSTKNYTSGFKLRVIAAIVRFVDDGLDYHPEDHVSKREFNDSGIFQTKPNRYKGDDLVGGMVGKTNIMFSEIDAKHVSGSGKNRRVRQIFKGLFFVADFNKHFSGKTVVVSDVAEKMFGRFGKMLQSMNFTRGQLIKLDDPQFERMFAVYADDQIEARYILSTSLMERMLNFRKDTGKAIQFSFVGSKIYVAIPYKKKLFEPKIFDTLLDFEPVQKYFEDLQLAIGVVEELNLNTRIWSKT